MERNVVKRIRRELITEFPDSVFYKIHGGDYQEAGIPDLIGCVNGFFFGFEVKEPGKEDTLSKYQKYQISRICQAGGVAAMVTCPERAIELVLSRLNQRE